jgi:hypothetical protein
MFFIGFVTAPRVDEQGRSYAEGELVAGEHQERFRSDLRAWHKNEYESQWKQGVARLLAGAQSSALVTSFGGPAGELRIIPLWREGSTVRLGEGRVISESLPEPFDPAGIYARVDELVAPTSKRQLSLSHLTAFAIDD